MKEAIFIISAIMAYVMVGVFTANIIEDQYMWEGASPIEVCGVDPEKVLQGNISLSEAQLMIEEYRVCIDDYRTMQGANFMGGVFWPIGLPWVIGIELAEYYNSLGGE